MKSIFNHIRSTRKLAYALVAVMLSSCFPDDVSDKVNAKALPDPTFTITPIAGQMNKYILSTSDKSIFMHQWDLGDGTGKVLGNSGDTIYYPSKGEYTIQLKAVNSNGSSFFERDLNVEEDDPNSCFGKKALLTGCATGESRTWVLAQPEGGALFVGPPGFGSAWWTNTAADINDAARACLFDDEYTFTKSGGYNFERFGTMRVDDENEQAWPTDIGLEIGCYDMSEIPEKYQAWGSGNFSFKIIGESKLQVIGTGAHMGLYKVGETGTAAAPESFITYDIVSLTETTLVIKKEYGWGGWRFTFKVKQ
jgi:PKD domain